MSALGLFSIAAVIWAIGYLCGFLHVNKFLVEDNKALHDELRKLKGRRGSWDY